MSELTKREELIQALEREASFHGKGGIGSSIQQLLLEAAALLHEDMALSQSSAREAALEEAARVCDAWSHLPLTQGRVDAMSNEELAHMNCAIKLGKLIRALAGREQNAVPQVYWLIERASPAEYWNGFDGWVSNPQEAFHYKYKLAAENEARSKNWGTDIRIEQHINC